jgi:surface antigen
LTEDQTGLQKAAQNVATTAPVGETIFWHDGGREGSAMTETESVMGGFTCRTFMQTIALEDYFDKASLTACRNASGAWITSF